MMDQKEFLKKMKLIFYQLFNRKLPFVIFEKMDPSIDESFIIPEWYFTNVDYETILMYDAKPDYFYGKVQIFDTEFANTFYTLFPLLKNESCFIRVVDFVSALSKDEDITQCTLTSSMSNIVLTYHDKGNLVSKYVGVKLLDVDVEMYKKVWWSGVIRSDFPYRKFMGVEDLKEDKFILPIEDGEKTPKHIPRQTKMIVQVGLTVPSLPIFLKNTKLTDDISQHCVIEAGYDGDSVITETKYVADRLLACIITQPSQRWFVRHNQIKEPDYGRESETNQTQNTNQETRPEQGLGEQNTSSQGEERPANSSSCTGTCSSCSGACKRKQAGEQ